MNKDVKSQRNMSDDVESDCRQEVTEDQAEICETSKFTTPDNHTFAWSVSERSKCTTESPRAVSEQKKGDCPKLKNTLCCSLDTGTGELWIKLFFGRFTT